jgi:hypothetical protein
MRGRQLPALSLLGRRVIDLEDVSSCCEHVGQQPTTGVPMLPESFTITPSGPFSLAEAAAFGFGQRDPQDTGGVMRLAFCLDGYQQQVGVEVRQDGIGGDVHCAVREPAGIDTGSVKDQVARVL